MSEQTAAEMKKRQLEREIAESGATTDEKVNMTHSLSKLWQFLVDEREHWKKRAASHGCDVEGGDVDCE